MTRRKLAAAALAGATLGALLGSCAEPAPPVPEEMIERARAVLQPFKEQLMGALMTALDEGPENAIRVCRVRAPEIAAELGTGGIRIGRTSHRLRNPANAPQPWIEPLLAGYLEGPAVGEPQAVWLDESTVGYVEPIVLQPFCLACHGPSVEPELLSTIRSLYPQDQATGFHAGDFRGLFWVTLPAESG